MSNSYFARILWDARRPLPDYTPDTLGQEHLQEHLVMREPSVGVEQRESNRGYEYAAAAAMQSPGATPVMGEKINNQGAKDQPTEQNRAAQAATQTAPAVGQIQAKEQGTDGSEPLQAPDVQANLLRSKAAPLQITRREPTPVSTRSRYSVKQPQAAGAKTASAVEFAALAAASVKADSSAEADRNFLLRELVARVESSMETLQSARLAAEPALPVAAAQPVSVAQPARPQAPALAARTSPVNSTLPATAPQLHIGELLLRVVDQAPVATASAPAPAAERKTREQTLAQRGADSRNFTRTL